MTANSLPEFELLMRFEGVEPTVMLEKHGLRIHQEYMGRFGGDPEVMTIGVLKVAPWHFLVRYRGPAESAEWLERAIQEAAAAEDGSAETATLEVVEDITSYFDQPDTS